MIFGLIHEDIRIVLKLGCFNLTTAISAVSILPAENVNKGNHLAIDAEIIVFYARIPIAIAKKKADYLFCKLCS